MNTSYLKTFIEVINLKNISKAAEKLYITQPAASKQLQLLEKEFGTILFKKDGRDILPTESGKELYKYALNILVEENKIYDKLKKANKDLDEEINIYSSSLPADYFLYNIIFEFNKIYPKAMYNIKKTDSKLVFNYIEDGIVNFGFTGAMYKKNSLKYIPIASDELIIAASAAKYSEFKDKTVPIEFLFEHDFILREKGSATLKTFESYLNTRNLYLENLKTKIRVEDNEVIKTLVKNNMGITIISKLAIEKEIKEGSIVAIKIKDLELKRQIYFVYHSNRYFSRTEEAFRDFIIEKYGNQNL